MKLRCQILILFISLHIAACSQTPSEEAQVIASSPTNPNVSQRSVDTREREASPGEAAFRPPRSEKVSVVSVPTGSLFDPAHAAGLYELHHNFSVGDMILISLDEQTSSQKSVDYNEDKNTRFQIQPLTVNAGPIHISDDDLNMDHQQSGEFNSSANTSQSNSLEGQITVYVVEMLPNDNLVVAGEKWITMNQGKEFIRFSGEVRIRDIDVNNTVSSAKVGNALIEYSGKGELQDNQKRSLLGKLFSIFG
ncbi:flagellar basal body L-ring protein FlgH [Alteromonas confluentis]|uniref:Flagellar biosynthesis protein FlgH n=1 Tax=Alteromonas confluentis TaxID=1656094 RepID=A0A1E7Z9P3_9ALTE|nr:flagellar basal body L-ring protein FlgH [Alteromonas confluentis]OFC70171.1 flagellar biosynthesis protein FlgH [Alteromonas confluentis]